MYNYEVIEFEIFILQFLIHSIFIFEINIL